MMKEAAKVTGKLRWRVEKFDGDPPLPGEHKEPVEIIEGGDGIPTRVIFRKESENGTE